MPWKLLAFIAVLAVVLVFLGFNLDNRCDVSLVFVKLTGVPVVLTILGSFILGLLAAFFLALGTGRRNARSRGRDGGGAGSEPAAAVDAAASPGQAPESAATGKPERAASGSARRPGKRR